MAHFSSCRFWLSEKKSQYEMGDGSVSIALRCFGLGAQNCADPEMGSQIRLRFIPDPLSIEQPGT